MVKLEFGGECVFLFMLEICELCYEAPKVVHASILLLFYSFKCNYLIVLKVIAVLRITSHSA